MGSGILGREWKTGERKGKEAVPVSRLAGKVEPVSNSLGRSFELHAEVSVTA